MFTIMKYNPLLLLLFIAALLSCELRELEYTPIATGAVIPVSIRWDKAQIDNPAEGATILLYREDGTLYRRYDASGSFGTYTLDNIRVSDADSSFRCDLRAEPGLYHVVVFNETLRPNGVPGVWISGILNEQLHGLRFRGLERLETFEAFASEYVNKRTNSVMKSTSGYSIVTNPGILTSWLSPTPLVVTPEMVTASNDRESRSATLNGLFDQLMDIHPERKVVSVGMKFLVMNLSHAHPSSFKQTQLQGLSTSYYLGLDRYSATPTTHQFTLNSAKYSKVENVPDTLSAHFTTFGRIGDVYSAVDDHQYHFHSNVLLYDTEDGSPWRYVPQPDDDDHVIQALPQNITVPLSKAFDEFDTQVEAGLDLQLYLNLRIHMPNDFEPWGKAESGFGGSINDWIDKNVNIKL